MKRRLVIFSALTGGILVLAACGSSDPPPPPPPANTPVPVVSEQPVEEPESAEEEASEQPAEEESADEAMSEHAEEMEASEEMEEMVEEPAEASEEESAEAVAGVRTFIVAPEQSKASYIVAEEFFGGALDRLGIEPGLVDTIGSTQEVSGELQLDLAEPANSVVGSQFSVNLHSLTSDQSRRDNRIREANLESNRYPLAEFTITSLENVPASYIEGEEVTFQANGDITIREITLPTTFDVTATLEGDTITGAASTQLTMTNFGFEPPSFANMFSVADDFMVHVEFVFVEQ